MHSHITVLLHEAVDALAIKPDGIYVDGTFGRGGHSRLILSKLGKSGKLIAFDKDPAAFLLTIAAFSFPWDSAILDEPSRFTT